MELENYMKLCMTEPEFLEKKFPPENWENGPKQAKNMVFWIYWKIWSLIFTKFVL